MTDDELRANVEKLGAECDTLAGMIPFAHIAALVKNTLGRLVAVLRAIVARTELRSDED